MPETAAVLLPFPVWSCGEKKYPLTHWISSQTRTRFLLKKIVFFLCRESIISTTYNQKRRQITSGMLKYLQVSNSCCYCSSKKHTDDLLLAAHYWSYFNLQMSKAETCLMKTGWHSQPGSSISSFRLVSCKNLHAVRGLNFQSLYQRI